MELADSLECGDLLPLCYCGTVRTFERSDFNKAVTGPRTPKNAAFQEKE